MQEGDLPGLVSKKPHGMKSVKKQRIYPQTTLNTLPISKSTNAGFLLLVRWQKF